MDAYIHSEQTLGGLLRTTAARLPHAEAVVHPEYEFRRTWSELSAEADALAKGLMASGVRKGEKIAVWAANVPHWLTLMFATARIGAVLMPINSSCREAELRYQLSHSECETLFLIRGVLDHDFTASIRELVPELANGDGWVSAALPHLKRICFLGEEPCTGMLSLSDLFELGRGISDAELAEREGTVNVHDVASMQYTSGTTGSPKGAMLTHLNIINNGYWTGQKLGLGERDRVCLPVPLFHCLGCVSGALACTAHGSTLVILQSGSPGRVLTALEQEKCTAFYGVPSLYQALLNHRQLPRTDLSALRTGIMAGSVCPEPLVRQVMEELHMPEISIAYGLTEASPVVTQTRCDDPLDARLNSVGRPLPGMEVTVLKPETGEMLPVGAIGEICCRGNGVMQGYFRMSEATGQTIDAQGRLHTGDLGFLDEQGFLHVSGRLKDIILRGGENVYPREIEEFLLQRGDVLDVQVVAVPSRRYGEEVGAFLIPRAGAIIRPEDVRAFCRGKLAWYKIPRYVAVLDSFPMTASGKVRKTELRDMAASLFPEAMRPAAFTPPKREGNKSS